MAAFAAARRASGVCGAGAGGFTLAASYTSCAPSEPTRLAGAILLRGSQHRRSRPARLRSHGLRPTRRATSSITAVPAALQFAPSLYEASLCSSANTRQKQPEPARCTPVRSTRWRSLSALRNTTLRTISSTGRNTMAPNVAHCRMGRTRAAGRWSSAFTFAVVARHHDQLRRRDPPSFGRVAGPAPRHDVLADTVRKRGLRTGRLNTSAANRSR